MKEKKFFLFFYFAICYALKIEIEYFIKICNMSEQRQEKKIDSYTSD